jgi:anti-anti-sigma factor
MTAWPHLRVEKRELARVVRFEDPMLWEDRVVRGVTTSLHELVQQMPRGHSLVLDFSGVKMASSSMLGTLLVLRRRLHGVGGTLRLCELDDAIRSVLRTTNLDRIFAIDRDAQESLEALGESAR